MNPSAALLGCSAALSANAPDERSDPNRREFIEWLKGISLKIPERERGQILGEETTLTVPCGTLDLS